MSSISNTYILDMEVVEETGILGIWIARNQAQVLQLPLWSSISSFYHETPPFIERVDARTLWAALESSSLLSFDVIICLSQLLHGISCRYNNVSVYLCIAWVQCFISNYE
jgi:hypothetical protein